MGCMSELDAITCPCQLLLVSSHTSVTFVLINTRTPNNVGYGRVKTNRFAHKDVRTNDTSGDYHYPMWHGEHQL
jgi:non-homologous end joining protein Ku